MTKDLPGGLIALALATLAPGGAVADRLEKCPVESQAEVAEAIKDAPSCAQAYEVLNVCRVNAAGDVAFAALVVDMCEKVFIPTLDPAASTSYQAARDACARRFAASEGTMAASLQATCEAGVAVVFAHRADLAAMRAKRAPYGTLAPARQ